MLKVIFTLDYEIHGNGQGCPRQIMTEPTQCMLRLFDEYGAKLTIMADVAEILKFKEYAAEHKKDDYNYGDIVSQLQKAVTSGHDVQLHLHASYFKATHNGRQWIQNWGEYDFANLDFDRMSGMIAQGKQFLESILRPVHPAYRCIAFRAANWSVSPSRNVAKALLDHGIEIDTSIFKYGRRNHLVTFDYSRAHSNLVPWRASEDDLCQRDDRSKLWEFPIYSEQRRIGAFLTWNRVCRVVQSHTRFRTNEVAVAQANHPAARKRTLLDKAQFLTQQHAWKADFNQCTGRQLIGALLRAERQISDISDDVPFVLIGHSKLYNSLNEKSLRPFLEFVSENKDRFGFETFGYFKGKIERQGYLDAPDPTGIPPIVETRSTRVARGCR